LEVHIKSILIENCARAEKDKLQQSIYWEEDSDEGDLNFGMVRMGCLCNSCINCDWKDDARTDWQDSEEEAILQWNEMQDSFRRCLGGKINREESEAQ
jgi:hypothetical protein